MTVNIQYRASVARKPLSHETGSAADPHGFTRILMDGALERIDAARESCGAPAVLLWERLQAALLLVHELRADLDLSEGGAIAANVDDLYDYIIRRLKIAAFQTPGSSAALDEVSHLLDALREAWMFMPAEVRTASRN